MELLWCVADIPLPAVLTRLSKTVSEHERWTELHSTIAELLGRESSNTTWGGPGTCQISLE